MLFMTDKNIEKIIYIEYEDLEEDDLTIVICKWLWQGRDFFHEEEEEREIVVGFFEFHEMRDYPRKMQDHVV